MRSRYILRVKLNPTTTPDGKENFSSLYRELVGRTITLRGDGRILDSGWRFWVPLREAELDKTPGGLHFRSSPDPLPNEIYKTRGGRLYLNPQRSFGEDEIIIRDSEGRVIERTPQNRGDY
jgi:hypothetical protein